MPKSLRTLISSYRSRVKKRWRALRHESKYRDLSSIEVNFDGQRLVFDTSDAYSKRWWFPRYLGGNLHEPAVTQLAFRLGKQAQWFADVGANIGWYTCLLAKLLPEGRVDAFEMNPQVCKILEKNIRKNHLDARVHNVALTAEPGEVFFLTEEAMGTYLPGNASRAGRTCRVEGRTLDEFCAGKQGGGLIKIDVEGAETDVLLGMRQLLRRADVELLVELHPWLLGAFQSSPGRVLEILRDHGFEVRELRGLRRETAELVHVDESQLVENTMIWATKSPALFG